MATITQAPARNSTTVRAPHRRDGDRLRTAFRLLESLAPTIGARWAGHLWFTIPETPRQARRRDDLPLGELVQVSVHGRRVVAETWGSGPAVYLVHGWGGWRTQLGGFVAPLVAAGYRVVAVDAPGHGDSEAGRHGSRQGSFVEFVDAWAATEYRLGPAQAVVAHSGGAAAVALALRAGLTPQRLVFIAPMADPMDYLEVFSRRLGIGPRIQQRLVPRLVRRAGVPMSDLDIPALPAALPAPPLLVIHDRDDAETPWSGGAAIAQAWPEAHLVTTTGLGHRRILRDPDVVRRATAFLS
jgi:pimeloyl-ACP methyl ester carboxylesterase